MKAAVLVGPGRFEVAEVPDPSPTPGQVLVRTHRAAICGSDLHVVYDGFHQHDFPAPPGYPGHEGVGVIVATGERVLTAPVPSAVPRFSKLSLWTPLQNCEKVSRWAYCSFCSALYDALLDFIAFGFGT